MFVLSKIKEKNKVPDGRKDNKTIRIVVDRLIKQQQEVEKKKLTRAA